MQGAIEASLAQSAVSGAVCMDGEWLEMAEMEPVSHQDKNCTAAADGSPSGALSLQAELDLN